jgi:ABC-2 type transport system ATP-binding protein
VETLSGGQKRRLDLAVALGGDPELLFLDEPTTGFDPSARRRAWTLIDGLRTLDKTILLTTHYMEEAQRLADRVAVISAGRIVAEGDPSTLAGREHRTAVVSFVRPEGISLAELPLPAGVAVQHADGHVAFRTATPTRDLKPLVLWAEARGRELDGLTVTRPSLEDVYLELTDAEAA